MFLLSFDRYEEDLQYFFLVQVPSPEGPLFVYNRRTFVHDIQFAKRFETRRSALRCIRLGDIKDYKIIKMRRP